MHDGGDNGVWEPILDKLPGFVQVAVVDMPAVHRAGVPRLADLLADRARELGLEAPHVVGHALGGAVALELARRMPVSGVTAFCPIGFWTRSHAWYMAVRFRLSCDPARLLATSDIQAARDAAGRVAGMWRYAFRHPESITAPVLLAWAMRDRLVPPTDANRARRRLPQARQVMIPSGGHLVTHDDPTTVAAVLFDWHQKISGN
ncbi:alpha/beta fold hydrolase [Actinophytocola sp.]|uniref:alpha/beta fold hydrolase n=1 Tax=Actinophytocola sp. TaxID=1872138 RepID=UPI0025C16824|nr:alpha/beta fold hydrolase [Actinophytocola sp.]